MGGSHFGSPNEVRMSHAGLVRIPAGRTAASISDSEQETERPIIVAAISFANRNLPSKTKYHDDTRPMRGAGHALCRRNCPFQTACDRIFDIGARTSRKYLKFPRRPPDSGRKNRSGV